jgi:hypothetical protein
VVKNQHNREGNEVAMREPIREKMTGGGGREREREQHELKSTTNPAFSQKIGITKIVVENNVLHSIEHNPDVLCVGCTCKMYV